jgi:hypothetical protein
MNAEAIVQEIADRSGIRPGIISVNSERELVAKFDETIITIRVDDRDNSLTSYFQNPPGGRWDEDQYDTFVLLRMIGFMDDDVELLTNFFPDDLDRETSNISQVIKNVFVAGKNMRDAAHYFSLGHACGFTDALNGR